MTEAFFSPNESSEDESAALLSEGLTTFPLNPEPSILIESLRDIDYSFNSALADIIDNSITAGAHHIDIYAIPTDDFRIAIIDDGDGLTRGDLKQAMRLGSTDPRQERKLNDLGRFGLGLKTASFSQCRRLTVASRCNSELNAFTWDLDLVVRSNAWMVLELKGTDDIPFIDKLTGKGTLVLWESLDRITGTHGSGKVGYDRIIDEAQDYLGLVFHRFLSGERGVRHIEIRVNNRIVEPIDPFNEHNRATQQSPVETICPGVSMQAYTLPHRSNYPNEAEYEKYALPGGYLRNQGVYLYRAKRLILHGTWFGLAKKTALTQLCRVKIDIGVEQDEAWKIDVKKVSAQLPEPVRSSIKQLISRIGAPSKKVYHRRGVRLTNPKAYPAWNIVKYREKTIYQISRENPIICSFRESLDEDDARRFESVLSLIESTFPTESLFYELSSDENSVGFKEIDEESLSDLAKTFFASMNQMGKDDETALDIMRGIELFSAHWQDVLDTLGIEER